MKAYKIFTLIVLAVAVLPQAALAQSQARAQVVPPTAVPMPNAPGSFAELAERLSPAVVNVSTTQSLAPRAGRDMLPQFPQFPPGSPFEELFRDFMERQESMMGDKPRKITSLGSGFVVDPSGYIVTNNHVVEQADEITVIMHDDTNLKAKIIGRDPKTDLALIKVEPKKQLTAVSWGDSDVIKVGDWIVAIGNPFGLGGTVTAGIISARARDIQSGPYDDFLQTDASINRGNSGGPMFNLKGEVIGVNTAIFSPTGGSVGIGFAIPSNLAKSVISQLKEFGKTRRGWLGVRIQSVTEDIAESIGLKKGMHGALVSGVTKDGPAEKAGIKQGDIVLAFNGHTVDEMRRLPRIVADTPIGSSVNMKIWRKGKEMTIPVKVGELEAAEEEGMVTPIGGEEVIPSRAPEVIGMRLMPITSEYRKKYEIDASTKGVLVIGVKPGTAADYLGVRPGDVIMEVNQVEVSNPSDIVSKIGDLKKAGRKTVLLLINRKGDMRFAVLQIDESGDSTEPKDKE